MSGSYQVIARKWRPQTFADVVGQDHVVRTLKNAIARNRIAHAYLFVGPRGTGKTSTARIFAKALNVTGGPKADFDPKDPIAQSIADGSCLDVIEIDGASNNGVEQVRELRDTVRYVPAQGKFKVYIIDEVHMLSTAAFNALLKTLEEPPAHAKFIFATTEVQKVLPTIISRCQRFDLKPIPTELIVQRLKKIAVAEKIKVSDAALGSIARMADGGMRDAQSIFDQMISFCGAEIAEPDVLDVYGLERRPAYHESVYMVWSTHHWKPLVNGYAGIEPASYQRTRALAHRFPTEEFLTAMRAAGVRYVVLHRGGYGPNQWARIEEALPPFAGGALREVASFAGDTVFELAPSSTR